MPDLNQQQMRVDASHFAMVPRPDLPRSTFRNESSLKTTFNAGDLIPIYLDEVLPGDVHRGQLTIFARLATTVFPIMDRIEIETFFFFIPNRLVWGNWVKMMGERANPTDSISYTIPQTGVSNGALAAGTLQDYFGLPIAINYGGDSGIKVNALPFRGYQLVWNQWFRDENLQDSIVVSTGDGPDSFAQYNILKRGKKHDYFTSCLPWPLKGGIEVSTPLAGSANVLGIALSSATDPTDGSPASAYQTGGAQATGWTGHVAGATGISFRTLQSGATTGGPLITADLSTATGVTINALRLAVQTQRLLERDARSGTRYTELLRAHFGVIPEDMRLQRPEYIGGGRTNMQTQAIPQTSATGLTGGTSPLGALGGASIASDQHSFTYHATEHGYIIGLANVRGELTYQQGLARLWTRQTRYDIYWPVFAHLGEQAVRNDEIYFTANPATNVLTFGYQERWAEYRHMPNRITGLFRSTASPNIDEWHLAEFFASAPALNATFITDPSKATVERALSVGAAAAGQQILWDSVIQLQRTRPMPTYSVPGMMDHF